MPEFWMRQVEVILTGKKLTAPPLQIHFRINFDTDPEPNDGEIVLYNLSDSTVNQVKKGVPIILNAGYRGDVGTIMAGVVGSVKGGWEGVDRVTRISAGDAIDKWASVVVNKSFAPGTRASQVIRSVLGDFGLEAGAIELPNDVVYTNGRTISSPLQLALRTICGDCGAKFHISNGSVYIRNPSAGTKTGFVLNSGTGLIESPQRIEGEEGKDYLVKSLLNHRIHGDSLIKIESRVVTGWFMVVAGKHICNEDDFITEMEVVAV